MGTSQSLYHSAIVTVMLHDKNPKTHDLKQLFTLFGGELGVSWLI